MPIGSTEEFHGVILYQCLVMKLSHEVTKFFHDCFEEVKRGFGVKLKFCEGMPFGGLVQELEE